jgi:hypothetical protein
MVSKAANYCFASKKNKTGFLLMSEVALGDMYESVWRNDYKFASRKTFD